MDFSSMHFHNIIVDINVIIIDSLLHNQVLITQHECSNMAT